MSYIAIECKQNHLPHVALRDDFLCYEPRTCRTVTNTTKASAVKQPKVKPLCLYPECSINLHGIHTAHQILSILMAVYFVQKPCVKMAVWNFTWIYALDKFLAVECYQSPSAPLLATKQMSIFNNKKSNSQTFPFLQGHINFTSCLCFRSDGVFVYTEGSAVVFQSGLTEEDQGLYTCRASFYHHGATVRIQVEVTSQDEQFGQGLSFCFFTYVLYSCPLSKRHYNCEKHN